MGKTVLYHTGFEEIRKPDVFRGRKNADFGQGFYTTADLAFARRWARQRKDRPVIINSYELDTEGLFTLSFDRDAAWFDYIYANRHLKEDVYREADLIEGPVANDTLFDVLGITTSGILKKEEALALLMVGPCYGQTAIRSERAALRLTFLGAEELSPSCIEGMRDQLAREEKDYLELFAKTMKALS